MTRTNKILLSVVALAAAIAAFYFMVLAPKREEVATLNTEIAAQEAAVEQARLTLAGYEEAKKSYKRNYATLARLGKAVPADDDVRSLMVQLESTADRSGVTFDKIEMSTSLAAPGGETAATPAEGQLASAPGAIPVSGGVLSAMPFSFSFSGSYFDLTAFFARLEHFVTTSNKELDSTGRLLRLESITIAPSSDRLPRHAGADQRRDVPRAARPGRHRGRDARQLAGRRHDALRAGHHDLRDHWSLAMNAVTSTWRQLVRRRLWPVAVLLLAALVAVPLLLAREPEPVAPIAPLAVSVEADDTIAEPVVAKVTAEDRARRRRVLGVRKDPFSPAPIKKAKVAKAPEEADTPEPAATSTGGSEATGGEPAPDPVFYSPGTIIVRFGAPNSEPVRLAVKKFEAVPDNEYPMLVYMGLTKNGKKAKFLVDAAVNVDGDGTCKPHPSNCEVIELAVGETEFLDVLNPEPEEETEEEAAEEETDEETEPEILGQFQLDLVDIKRKGDTDVR